MKKAIWAAVLFLVGSVVMVVALRMAHAEELNVKLTCSAGKCVPAGGSAVNTAKVNALLYRAGKLRKQIADLLEAGNGRAGDVAADVADLKKKVSDLEKSLQQVDGDAKAGKVDGATALKKIADVEKALELLGGELYVNRLARRGLMRSVIRLESRRINLEVGGFGGYASTYGGTGGALASLVLPMGERGLWTTRLSGGLGVSPSLGLGWLADVSVTARLNSHLALGPAILALGDQGDLLSSTKSWLIGGGAEVRVSYHNLFLTVTPFLGVAVKKTASDNEAGGASGSPPGSGTVVTHACVPTPCGCYDPVTGQNVETPAGSAAPAAGSSGGRTRLLAGGVLISIGVALF